MAEYLSPGVYVEEVDRGPKPIQGVGTAMPVFLGFSEKAEEVKEIDGEKKVENLLSKPQLITNWSQYVKYFGGFVSGAYLPHAVYGYFLNGGTRCYVVSVRKIPKARISLNGADGLKIQAKQAGSAGQQLRVSVDAPKLLASSELESESESESETTLGSNQGSNSEINEVSFDVTVEKKIKRNDGSETWNKVEKRRIKIERKDTADDKKKVMVTKNTSKLIDVIIPENMAMGPLDQIWPNSVNEKQLVIAEMNQLEAPTTAEFKGDVEEREGIDGLEAIEDITMVCVPDLMTPLNGKLDHKMVQAVQTSIIAHCERMGDRVAILDAPPTPTKNSKVPKKPDIKPQEVLDWRMNYTGYDSSYATLYYPWIEVNDPVTDQPIYIPPSGHIAGVWARNDNTRGVYKAPANEVIRGVTGLAYNPTKGEQDVLNPKNINCIRKFPGRGIRVWGARTLTSNPAWRYINVRRLFNYVEKSIELNTQWVVFEPNDHKLWAKVRRDVKAFLTTVWRDGALFGQTPKDAFYVKCDEELNPLESRDQGRLIIEIGMAPVKPAEFVIFRISQWAGPNAEA